MMDQLLSPLRIAGFGLLMTFLWSSSGCAHRQAAMMDAFPHAGAAAPWRLEGDIWSGTIEQAANSLGADAAGWQSVHPERVWLAVYHHEDDPPRRLIVRAFSFTSGAAAELAFERHRPEGAKAFKAGNDGCWTADGVMFRWGRLVYDIFGVTDKRRVMPEQVISMVGRIEHMMPPGMPDNPR